MAAFNKFKMSNLARKPPASPTPKITRPLAQPESPTNPITREIMQRARQIIFNSKGVMTLNSVADDIGVSQPQFREWASGFRSMPYGDNLIKIQRWLAVQDKSFISDVFTSKRVKFKGDAVKSGERSVRSILSLEQVPKDIAADIRQSPKCETDGDLAIFHKIPKFIVSKIRNARS